MTQGTGEKGNWEGTPHLTACLVVAPSFTTGELPKGGKKPPQAKILYIAYKIVSS